MTSEGLQISLFVVLIVLGIVSLFRPIKELWIRSRSDGASLIFAGTVMLLFRTGVISLSSLGLTSGVDLDKPLFTKIDALICPAGKISEIVKEKEYYWATSTAKEGKEERARKLGCYVEDGGHAIKWVQFPNYDRDRHGGLIFIEYLGLQFFTDSAQIRN